MFSEERVLTPGKVVKWQGGKGRVLSIHYAADPAKDADWAARVRAQMPDREWQREMEGFVNVFDGEPVYPMYERTYHEERIDWPKSADRGVAVAGWDCGVTINPAFVLGFVRQPVGEPAQLQVLCELSYSGMSMEQFAPKVEEYLQKNWPAYAMWRERIIHVGDPTGASRQGAAGETAFGVARRHGFYIRKSAVSLNPRLSCVTRFLMRWAVDEEKPLIVFNKPRCQVLCEGLGGGYCYKKKSGLVGNAQSLRQPDKNGYSHVQDALQYLCIEAEKHLEGKANYEPIDRLGSRRSSSNVPIRYV